MFIEDSTQEFYPIVNMDNVKHMHTIDNVTIFFIYFEFEKGNAIDWRFEKKEDRDTVLENIKNLTKTRDVSSDNEPKIRSIQV